MGHYVSDDEAPNESAVRGVMIDKLKKKLKVERLKNKLYRESVKDVMKKLGLERTHISDQIEAEFNHKQRIGK
jgi:hypothetical protein